MNAQTSPTAARQIYWPSVITVISAAILIGAEVFGAAFAGGWALAILFGLDDTGAHILQAVLFAIGVFIMVAFIRAARGGAHRYVGELLSNVVPAKAGRWIHIRSATLGQRSQPGC